MTGVIASHIRKAAHGRHRCVWCRQPIAARSEYHDMRIVDGGTVYTSRRHIACDLLGNTYCHMNALSEGEWPDWGEVLAWAAEEGMPT